MLRLALISLVFLAGSCKTKYVVKTEKEKSIETEFRHSSEVVTLPTHYRSVTKCPEIDQQIELGGTTIDLKAIGDSLRVEIMSEERLSKTDTIYKDRFVEKIVTEKEEVIKFRTPKWNWYIMGALLLLVLWAYRGLIWGVLKKLIRPI